MEIYYFLVDYLEKHQHANMECRTYVYEPDKAILDRWENLATLSVFIAGSRKLATAHMLCQYINLMEKTRTGTGTGEQLLEEYTNKMKQIN